MSNETSAQSELIHLTIDGQGVDVPKGTTVYAAAKKIGIDLPIFCYQDRMPPFGACRVCLVEVENIGKPQASCTLIAAEGMVVKTQSDTAVDARKSILELLLINHPLDCPICDRGGECPLQENAINHGPGKSRFYEEKRRFKKPIPLGSVLMLDRERCITCARCTRFGDEIAGDHALEFFDRGYKTIVATPDGKPVESKFIGNTIMICPVGALTSQVYRFRARPWDNQANPTTCTLCPVGCSMSLDSRDGEIVRTRSEENSGVNDIWLCDKGWFGYEFANHKDRLQYPLLRQGNDFVRINWDEAFQFIADAILKYKSSGMIAGFGGNPLTVEENYLFQQLLRKAIASPHVDHRIGQPLISLEDEVWGPGMEMSIGECEQLSFAILLGVDLTEEFPVLWLRLRQAINRGAATLYMGYYEPEIKKYLTHVILHNPGKEYETLKNQRSQILDLAKNGKKGAVFVGQQYLSNPARAAVIAELMELQAEIPNLKINLLEGEENSFGARIAGMRPDCAAFGESLSEVGFNALEVLQRAAEKEWGLLYVAGANPAKKFPSGLWKEARKNLKCLIVQELFMTETARDADLVLPALCYLEKEGSFVNVEGRIQKINPLQNVKYADEALSDAEIFTKIASKLDFTLALGAEFSHLLKQSHISLVRNSEIQPRASNVKEGLKLAFAPALFDQGVRMKHNPHLIQLSKRRYARIHPQEAAHRGVLDGAAVTIKTIQGQIEYHLKYDKRVSIGTLLLPKGVDEFSVAELSIGGINGINVEI